jgi:hypothetical protein
MATQFSPLLTSSCANFHFLGSVHISCEELQVKVTTRDVFDYQYVNGTTSSFVISVNLNPEDDPEFITVQDPASPDNYDKLVGVALDGIPIYSGLSASGCDVFYPNCNGTAFEYDLDACGGSFGPTPDGWRYHYRTVPTCLFVSSNSAVDQRKMLAEDVIQLLEAFSSYDGPQVLGYTLTGRPIYSPLTDEGSVYDDLDNCNGKLLNGVYSYFMTPTFPYTVGCEGPGVFYKNQYGNVHVANFNINGQCPSGMYRDVNSAFGCIACAAGKYSFAK